MVGMNGRYGITRVLNVIRMSNDGRQDSKCFNLNETDLKEVRDFLAYAVENSDDFARVHLMTPRGNVSMFVDSKDKQARYSYSDIGHSTGIRDSEGLLYIVNYGINGFHSADKRTRMHNFDSDSSWWC